MFTPPPPPPNTLQGLGPDQADGDDDWWHPSRQANLAGVHVLLKSRCISFRKGMQSAHCQLRMGGETEENDSLF